MSRQSLKSLIEFSGIYEGDEPAQRWLNRLDFDLESIIDPVSGQPPPRKWLQVVQVLLKGKAATWFEQELDVQIIINKVAPTPDDIRQIKKLMQDEFPQESTPVETPVDIQLAALKQEPGEKLISYYQRGLKLFKASGGREILSGTSVATKLEKTALKTFARTWTKGLIDSAVRDMCIPTLTRESLSLASVYEAAEEFTKAHAIRMQQQAAEEREKEFELYKKLATEEFPPNQLNAMMQACHIRQSHYNAPIQPRNQFICDQI